MYAAYSGQIDILDMLHRRHDLKKCGQSLRETVFTIRGVPLRLPKPRDFSSMSNEKSCPNEDAFQQLARRGCTEILELFLPRLPIDWYLVHSMVRIAAVCGHVALATWLKAQVGEVQDAMYPSIRQAASTGQYEGMAWLYHAGLPHMSDEALDRTSQFCLEKVICARQWMLVWPIAAELRNRNMVDVIFRSFECINWQEDASFALQLLDYVDVEEALSSRRLGATLRLELLALQTIFSKWILTSEELLHVVTICLALAMKNPVEQLLAILEWLVQLVELEIVAHVFHEYGELALYHAISKDDARLISFLYKHGVVLEGDYILENGGADVISWYLSNVQYAVTGRDLINVVSRPNPAIFKSVHEKWTPLLEEKDRIETVCWKRAANDSHFELLHFLAMSFQRDHNDQEFERFLTHTKQDVVRVIKRNSKSSFELLFPTWLPVWTDSNKKHLVDFAIQANLGDSKMLARLVAMPFVQVELHHVILAGWHGHSDGKDSRAFLILFRAKWMQDKSTRTELLEQCIETAMFFRYENMIQALLAVEKLKFTINLGMAMEFHNDWQHYLVALAQKSAVQVDKEVLLHLARLSQRAYDEQWEPTLFQDLFKAWMKSPRTDSSDKEDADNILQLAQGHGRVCNVQIVKKA
ncbi:hypothetical protein AC1031_011594 [Aphanomyces cochlioides]|nr:hypothetical protein AC1031_011594 [Aphanomyces cochlioides]